MTQAGQQTVDSVAAAVRSGAMDVEAAVAALRRIEPSSNLGSPPKSIDEAYISELEQDVVEPSDANNPNRLYFEGKVGLADYKRMHEALMARPESSADPA